MEKLHKGISKRKNFRYPPILPIVYYEGRNEWTAPMDFKSRVNRSDEFGDYIPDFKYYLVPIQKYSNDELLSKEDEISLIMMINKIQTLEDVTIFRNLPEERLNKILANTPEHILDIIVDILTAFQLKANVPLEEAEENAGKVREKNVARLFENADLGDVQARRREMAELKEQVQTVKEQIKEAKKVIQEVKEQKEEIEKQKEAAEKQKEAAEKQKEAAEKQKEAAEKQKEAAEERVFAVFIETLKECDLSRENSLERLRVKFGLGIEEAEEKMNRYWNK